MRVEVLATNGTAARIAEVLGAEGIEVRPAPHPAALRGAGVVLVEHAPPRIDAGEVVRSLRRAGGRGHLVVVASDGSATAWAGADWGADDWLLDGWSDADLVVRAQAGLGLVARRRDTAAPSYAAALPADPGAACSDDILCSAATRAAERVGVDSGLLFRFAPPRAELLAVHGGERSPAGSWFEMLEEGALPEVLSSGEAVRIDQRPRPIGRQQSQNWYIGPAYVSCVAAPLRAGRRLWGALIAASTTHDPIRPHAEDDLAALAADLALPLVNATGRARVARLRTADLETGLLNRPALLERLPGIAAGAAHDGIHVSVLCARVTGGENGVDRGRLLSDLGGLVTGMMRAGDAVGRVASDEVAWVMVGVARDEAAAAADELAGRFAHAPSARAQEAALRVATDDDARGEHLLRMLARVRRQVPGPGGRPAGALRPGGAPQRP